MPRITKRSSSQSSRSSRNSTANGSSNTRSASSKLIPCLVKLSLALDLFHSNFKFTYYGISVVKSRGRCRDRRAKLQHTQDPIRRDSRNGVFHRVAADNAAQIENRAVGGFKDFRERVDEQGDDEVGATRVTGREKCDEYQKRQQRAELCDNVGPEVVVTASQSDTPIQHTRDAENQQGNKRACAGLHADTFVQRGGQQGHKPERHRKPVPYEPSVAWVRVIVSGAESRESDTGEKDEVGPPFTRIEKSLYRMRCRAIVQDKAHAQQAYDQEKYVR